MDSSSIENKVLYRTNESKILNDILLRPKKYLYPLIHLYGLSGTGKTYFIKQFLSQLQESQNSSNQSIYLNSIELCHSQVDQLYSEISIGIAKSFGLDENMSTTTINNASSLLRFLKKKLQNTYSDSNFLLVIDHVNYLSVQNKMDLNEFFLLLTKFNDYLVENCIFKSVSVILISEYDWHSLLYDMDLVSNTELQRPFCIYFNDYTKEQMYSILCKDYGSSHDSSNRYSYTRIILEVFYSICKDLNELSYIVDTYYSHLCESMASLTNNEDHTNSMAIWNKMKPFLKQALTKIYLRESFHGKHNSTDLSRQFESLNLNTGVPISGLGNEENVVDLPIYAKYLLISAYVATHNAAKYDKKLFEYGEGKTNARKIRYTSNYYQKTDELRHSAILKLQQFDLNRLMGIFYSLIFMHNSTLKSYGDLNLNSILSMLQMLKNFNFIQQLNSSYSCLDEPKYKCLIDFKTIASISKSLQINIKQYLCEYFL
jgi:origin recognition complex subunit 5